MNTCYDFNIQNNSATNLIDYDCGSFLSFSNPTPTFPLIVNANAVQNNTPSVYYAPTETAQDIYCKPNFPVEEKAPQTTSTATNSCSPNASTENTYSPVSTNIWTEESYNEFGFANNQNAGFYMNAALGDEHVPCDSPQDGPASANKGAKSKQSLFKNKYKESLEQAKALLDEIYKWSAASNSQAFHDVRMEALKTAEDLREEGYKLQDAVRLFEEDEKRLEKVQDELEKLENDVKREKTITTELNKLKKKIAELTKNPSADKKAQKKAEKQLEKARGEEKLLQREKAELKERLGEVKVQEKRKKEEHEVASKMVEARKAVLLDALKYKRFSKFADITNLIDQIKTHVSKKESLRFFDAYKKKRSMKYLEECNKSDELYYWIVLIKIVLTMLPENKENLRLLPLEKDTVSFMYWMVDSTNMKVKHRTLFKSYYVRSKLRNEFTRVCNILIKEARNKVDSGDWTQEKWDSMVQVLSAGEETPGLFLSGDAPITMEDDSNQSTNDSTPKRPFEDFDYNSDCFDVEDDYPMIKTQKRVSK